MAFVEKKVILLSCAPLYQVHDLYYYCHIFIHPNRHSNELHFVPFDFAELKNALRIIATETKMQREVLVTCICKSSNVLERRIGVYTDAVVDLFPPLKPRYKTPCSVNDPFQASPYFVLDVVEPEDFGTFSRISVRDRIKLRSSTNLWNPMHFG